MKDAASTSIYGTRAAFGVILITTKSAKKTDKITINYTNNFSWDTPSILPNFPDVSSQARALRAANIRMGVENELFGMYMNDSFINKADAWKQRHGGKAGYREMIPGDDLILTPELIEKVFILCRLGCSRNYVPQLETCTKSQYLCSRNQRKDVLFSLLRLQQRRGCNDLQS